MGDPIDQRATAQAPRLSEEIGRLVAIFVERRVLLREVVEVTQGRGYMLLLVLLALPFCTPIPLPGLSTVFGVVVALVGFRLTLRQQPWLPKRVLVAELPQTFFPRFLAATRKLVQGMEWFLMPRAVFLVDVPLLQHLYGALIFICGLLMLLPLPLPFSNGLPALTVVLLAAGLLERDGYCVVAGLLMFGVTLAYFGALVYGGATVMNWMKSWLWGWYMGR